MSKTPQQLKAEILELTREYSRLVHSDFRPSIDERRGSWTDGEVIPYAGRVFTEDEVEAAVGSTLDFWLTLGKEGDAFQNELSSFLGIKRCLLVNSGSSANLIAISTLTSTKLPIERRIVPGDEVITVAAGFPTTVAPIIQVGAIPVFIDADPVTGNAKCDQLEDAYRIGKTKAVMMAHALGNPFDLAKTLLFCRKYNLWLIEDNCDALGSSYSMPKELAVRLGFTKNSPGLDEGSERIVRWTGTWGDLSTQSFYPPHHLTMGEGGSVNIQRDTKLATIAESIRDWGRDCWCPSGVDNSCGKRFAWQLGKLPEGYDHKYTYSHLGYNLKPLDPQAAIGRIQLKRLHAFCDARKKNWLMLRKGLDECSTHISFSLPTHSVGWNKIQGFQWDASGCKSDCSWFGFKINIKADSPIRRTDLAKELDKHKIGNRMFFGGNLVRQPAFTDLKIENKQVFRAINNLSGSDQIMMNTLFLGTYPGLTKKMINKEISVISEFIKNHGNFDE